MRRPPSSPQAFRVRLFPPSAVSRSVLFLCLLLSCLPPPAEGFRFDSRVLPPPEPGANAPAIAKAPGGPVWIVYRTASKRPRAARLEPDGTWRAEDLGETGPVRAHPAIAVDPTSGGVGVAYYVYWPPEEYNDGFPRCALRSASGAWSRDAIEQPLRPDLRIGRNALALGFLDGAPWIVASRSTSSLAYLYRGRPGGGWGAGIQLTTKAGSGAFAAADADPLGDQVVAVLSGSTSDPLLLRRASGPGDLRAETVSFGRPVTRPALALDPRRGDLHLAAVTADGRELLHGTGSEGNGPGRSVPLSLAPGEILGGLPALAVAPRTGTVAVAIRARRGADSTERLLVAIRRNDRWASFDLGGAAPEEGSEFASHRAALAVSGDGVLVLYRDPAGNFVLAEGRGEPPAPPAPREPQEGAILTTVELPAFRWDEPADPEGDPLSCDLYLSRSREAVEALSEEARIGIAPGSGDARGPSRREEIPAPGAPLEPGVHYWRIVLRDRDGLAAGEIRSFTVALPTTAPTGAPSPEPTAEPSGSPAPTAPDATPGVPTGPPAPTGLPSPSAGPDPSAAGSPVPTLSASPAAGGAGGGCDTTGGPGGIGLLAAALGALFPTRGQRRRRSGQGAPPGKISAGSGQGGLAARKAVSPGLGGSDRDPAQSDSEAAPRIAASAPRAARRRSSVSR